MNIEDRDAYVMRLLQRAVPSEKDSATAAILEAAMRAAVDVCHECGDSETTDAFVIKTFTEAVHHAVRRPGGAECPESCSWTCTRCYPDPS